MTTVRMLDPSLKSQVPLFFLSFFVLRLLFSRVIVLEGFTVLLPTLGQGEDFYDCPIVVYFEPRKGKFEDDGQEFCQSQPNQLLPGRN